jgi:hypothetical protein
MRAILPFEFENWAVIALGGISNKVQVGDMGVDACAAKPGCQPRRAVRQPECRCQSGFWRGHL